MNSPKIDILLATYNGEKYLPELLESLTQQTLQDFRILAHDDGSTDQTLAIFKNFQKDHPDKISLFINEGKPVGAIANFSNLLEISSAPYAMLCDQDDIWLPGKAARSLDALQHLEQSHLPNTPALLHTDLAVAGPHLEELAPSFFQFSGLNPTRKHFHQLLVQNIITGCAAILNRALIELATPIPQSARMHDWWLALVASGLGAVGVLSESTILYRQHGENTLGANRFNLRYIWQKAKEISAFGGESILAKNFKQAEAFRERFSSVLPPENLEILNRFISIQSENFWQKRATLLKYGYTKGKIAQNIGLLLKI